MRQLLNIIIGLTIAVVVAGVVCARQSEERSATTAVDVNHSLTRLYERTSYYGALEKTHVNEGTLWPAAVKPEWFGGKLPVNGLLLAGQPDRPWIDVAPPGDESIHPPDPVALRPDQAQFWYNPNIGLFRARVAATLSDSDALALYNQVNGVSLSELERDIDPQRIPLAYTPGTAPGPQLASQGGRTDQITASIAPPTEDKPRDTYAALSLFDSDTTPLVEEEPARSTRRATLKDMANAARE